ncbi:MAG: hypothetical protein P8X77_08760, partial [Maritimibacter sp.]
MALDGRGSGGPISAFFAGQKTVGKTYAMRMASQRFRGLFAIHLPIAAGCPDSADLIEPLSLWLQAQGIDTGLAQNLDLMN